MYSEALSQMHLPHSHLPWLLQMPWERRGDSRHPRAIVDTQRHQESARRQLPVVLSLGHQGNLLQPCLVWVCLVQAGQDLPLGCRCRCRCLWDIHSPDPPSHSGTRRRPWSSGRDLQRKRRCYPGTGAAPLPGPVCASPAFFWGAEGLQTDSMAPSLHICKPRVPTAHWSLNPPRHQPGTPRLCHQDGARHSESLSWGMLGAAGLLSPLQRKPEVRGHCRTSYWQNGPSKRCVRSSE